MPHRLTCAIVAVAFPAIAATPVDLLPGQQAIVQKVITKALIDPRSAKFSTLSAVQHDNGDFQVCGTVNAKNSFGGYVGATPFVGRLVGNELILTKIAPTPSEAMNMMRLCETYGATIVE